MNPYEVLAVGVDATADDIDKAYRKASLKHHPDRGGNAESFKEVNEAYEILSDPERRQHYDRTGETTKRRRQNEAVESMVATMIADAFAQEIIDPIHWMKQRLDARRTDHQEMRDKLKTGLMKLSDRITAFRKANESTSNPEGRDFVLENLTAGEIEIQRDIEKHEAEVELLTQALTLLNDLRGRRATGWSANGPSWGATPPKARADGKLLGEWVS